MSILANFNYNGTVIQRREDGFINLTQMCQANGKRLDHFLKANKTKEYIESLSNSLQMGVVQSPHLGVLDSERGGDHSGTWGHPSLAINLARWISSDFAVWCDAHIFNLMASGKTSLDIDPVQMMQLKIELAKLEAEKTKYENKTLELRNTIVKTCSEPVQQKIFGYSVIEKVEYRDRVIFNNQVINEGDTLNKTELCHRYGILTKNGKPDYRRLNTILDQNGITERSEAWEMSAVIQENYQFKREYLPALDNLMINSDRQLFLCE